MIEHRRQPVSIQRALASFTQLWSPRILAHVNDYDVRVAKVSGVHMWHRHDDTDEFFFVIDGMLDIGLRDGGEERRVHLDAGDVFVVPRGVEHRPESAGGASLLLIEPSGTMSTGDAPGEVPDHIDSTVGHALALGD
jgi:mannose-6-phosphate isomerase-like protein (cupin superfamily)